MLASDKPVTSPIFHRQSFIDKHVKSKCESHKKSYICKLSDEQIKSIEDHYQSDNMSFPLPDKKYKGKRFMRYSLKHSARMYNLSQSTTQKISTATYCHYKPKAVKLRGQIPFRQSCCAWCQNFENVLTEASKYLSVIPSDVGEAIDKSMCEYSGYFPKLDCVIRKCDKCGTEAFKNLILQSNVAKMKDKRKRFLVKLWVTKTERKEGIAQSYLHWKFERCNYIELINLLMEHMSKMSEHTFIVSWNYVQYKQAKKISCWGILYWCMTSHKITHANIRMKSRVFTGDTSK